MPKKLLPDAAQPVSDVYPMPAPVGGWNARDQLALMPSTDAVVLDNWFPQSTEIVIRPGYVQRATGPVGETIKSLFGLSKYDGTFKRFLATQTGIYDCSTDGAVGAVASAATTGTWQHLQINVAGVSFLWCCSGDGTNKSRIYNGDTGVWTVLDAASAPPLTGPTSESMANISMFKNRIVLTQAASTKMWYGPLNSVGGAYTAFDLGAVFKRGGFLMATANWTVDAGDGPDDRFVAVSSEGEIAVYVGTDFAATFSLVGVYFVGKPIGRRCFTQYGAELAILTEQGLWPLSKALQNSMIDKRVALTDKIQSAFNQHFKTYGALPGWEAKLLAKGPALIVNVPYTNGSYQFVMNTITGAWCRFKGWDSTCFLIQDGKFYFANGNKVNEGWSGTKDGTAGIYAYSRTAYSYGGSRRRSKKVNMVQPIMTTTSAINLSLAIDTDFQTNTVTASTVEVNLTTSKFGAGTKYGVAKWGGGNVQVKRWHGVKSKVGMSFSLRLGLTVNGIQVSWSATNFLLEDAGILG